MQSTDPSPKPKPKRWRRWLAGAFLAGTLVLLSTPWWWPWVLIPVLKQQGVAVARYDRDGASRLDLFDVGFTNDDVAISADRVAVQSPHRWLFDRLGWSAAESPPQLEITGWQARLLTSTETNRPASTNSLAATLNQAVEILGAARPWLREMEARDGTLHYSDRTNRVESLVLNSDSLSATLADPTVPGAVNANVRFPRPDVFELTAAVPDLSLRSSVRLIRANTDWRLEGDAEWRTNRAAITGVIGTNGWMPASLQMKGEEWRVPGETIGLDGRGSLTGGFDLQWTNGMYQFVARADAVPTIDNPLVPESVHVDIAGSGTMTALAVNRFDIATPVLNARLSDVLAVDFAGRLLVPEATLLVSANVEPDAGLPITGLIEGTVTARPDLDDVINARFALHVTKLESAFINLDRLDLNGALRWPSLVVSNASVALPDAGNFRMNGELDLVHLVSTNVHWTFEGTAPTNVLPDGLSIRSINATGTIAGGWPELRAVTTAQLTGTEWNGSRAEEIEIGLNGLVTATNDWRLRMRHGTLALNGSGTADLSRLPDSAVRATIAELTLSPTTNASLQLAQSVVLEAGWSTNLNGPFRGSMTPLKLSGSGKELELTADVLWPRTGRISVTATNITTDDLAGLWADQLPDVSVRDLAVTAGWDGGPVVFSAFSDLDWKQPFSGTNVLTAHVRVRGNPAGVEFSPVRVRAADLELFHLKGTLPLQIVPGAAEPVQWLSEGVIDARLTSQAGDSFWNEFTRPMGMAVTEPRLNVTASGSLNEFQAVAAFDARSLSTLQFTNLPSGLDTISNLHMHATADRSGIRLEDGTFVVAGQTGRITASLPFKPGGWSDWLKEMTELDWKQAEGTVSVPVINLTAVMPELNELLTSSGEASVQLSLDKGGALNGSITVTNLATRPIEPLGSVREINGRIEFNEHRAEITRFHALLNGQPMHLGGSAGWTTDGLTNARVFLQATNISMVRSVDLFLRGDLDLQFQTDGRTPPVISGEVLLNNSLLFQDIGDLVAIDLNQPAKRPPFFSVPVPPLADWKLDVRVRGQKFLRVLSPVFKGRVSTGMQITGTLKEPMALGEVVVENGQILFPFGSLDLTRGVVQLARQNPHQPRVDFRAQGLNFGYNVSLEVTGTAESPNVSFSSVPPLNTREILLMLTAGEIPSGAYSYTDVDKASKLGYFLGKELINQLLGFDTGEDKLVFRTGEYVTDDGQLTYRIEYKLLDWLSVFGEYTRFRDYNGGLKFNIYSR